MPVGMGVGQGSVHCEQRSTGSHDSVTPSVGVHEKRQAFNRGLHDHPHTLLSPAVPIVQREPKLEKGRVASFAAVWHRR